MSGQLIVFDNETEVIVGNVASVNRLIEFWFLNSKRNLDEYNTYLIDGSEGAAIVSRVKVDDIGRTDIDVTELMPDHLRKALIDADLLDDEE